MDRPTFFHGGDPIRAGGMLVYVRTHQGVKVLVRFAKGKVSDIGGKTDKVDTCIEDTVAREVWEETNGGLYGQGLNQKAFMFALKQRLHDPTTMRVYNKKCKYMLFVVEESHQFLGLPMHRFGLREDTDGMNHYYRWEDAMMLKCLKLHFRLRVLEKDLRF